MRPVDYATACARWCSCTEPYRARPLFQRRIRKRSQYTVYVRSKCGDATTILGCNDGNLNGMNNERNQGAIALSGVEPGNYYIIVDTKFAGGSSNRASNPCR